MVRVDGCIVRDTAGGRCDSLEIEFGNAASWYSWGPEEDDQIVVTHNGYDSGLMYVNRIIPENGKYRILATSLPCKAREKGYKSFREMSLEEIVRTCAMSSGMDFRIFGIDEKAVIPYIERSNETYAAFLYRLLTLEGAALKCVNGKYTAIGYEYAQKRNAALKMILSSTQEGMRYRRNGTTFREVTVISPYAEASAVDLSVPETHVKVVSHLPAKTNAQAGRWARGKLMHLNRHGECVVVSGTYNAGMTAMIRADIEGDTDASGEWLVEEAEHDLVNLTTTTTLHRCIWTIQ